MQPGTRSAAAEPEGLLGFAPQQSQEEDAAFGIKSSLIRVKIA
jgi:hypothetical protein